MTILILFAAAGPAVFTYAGSGGVTLSGAAEVSRSRSYLASGGVTLAGTAGVARTWAPIASGAVVLGGQADVAMVQDYSPTDGEFLIDGAASFSFESAVLAAPGGGLDPRDRRRRRRAHLAQREEVELLLLAAAMGTWRE